MYGDGRTYYCSRNNLTTPVACSSICGSLHCRHQYPTYLCPTQGYNAFPTTNCASAPPSTRLHPVTGESCPFSDQDCECY